MCRSIFPTVSHTEPHQPEKESITARTIYRRNNHHPSSHRKKQLKFGTRKQSHSIDIPTQLRKIKKANPFILHWWCSVMNSRIECQVTRISTWGHFYYEQQAFQYLQIWKTYCSQITQMIIETTKDDLFLLHLVSIIVERLMEEIANPREPKSPVESLIMR